MIVVERFDRRTMAAMEVALERACDCWPHGGKHKLRKHVAQSIIRCARAGNTRLEALIEAGECAVAQISNRRKPVGLSAQPRWPRAA